MDLGPYLAVPTGDLSVISPDGSRMWIPASAPASGDVPAANAVFVVDLRSGRPIARLDDAAVPAWSPDGTRLAFVRATDTRQVEVADSDGSNRHPVGPPAPGLIDQLVWVH